MIEKFCRALFVFIVQEEQNSVFLLFVGRYRKICFISLPFLNATLYFYLWKNSSQLFQKKTPLFAKTVIVEL